MFGEWRTCTYVVESGRPAQDFAINHAEIKLWKKRLLLFVVVVRGLSRSRWCWRKRRPGSRCGRFSSRGPTGNKYTPLTHPVLYHLHCEYCSLNMIVTFFELAHWNHQSLLHVRSGESYHEKNVIEHFDLLGIPLWNQSTFLEWVWGFFTSIFRRAISDNGLVTHYTRSILVLISLKCTCILHFTNH